MDSSNTAERQWQAQGGSTGFHTGLIVLFFGLVGLFNCTSATEPLPTSTEFAIELHWDAPESTDDPLRIENDLGIVYHLDTAYLVTFSLEFLFCEDETSTLERIWNLFRISSAYAGHGGDETVEERRLISPLVENLRTHEVVTMGTFMPMDGSYCSAFYLIGRAEEQHGIADLPADVDMTTEELSLILSGTYTLPGGDQAVPFVFSTRSAQGRTDDLTNAKGHIHPLHIPTTTQTLHITRNLYTMLDGVDISTMDDDDAGTTIIRNLIESTDIQIMD